MRWYGCCKVRCPYSEALKEAVPASRGVQVIVVAVYGRRASQNVLNVLNVLRCFRLLRLIRVTRVRLGTRCVFVSFRAVCERKGSGKTVPTYTLGDSANRPSLANVEGG